MLEQAIIASKLEFTSEQKAKLESEFKDIIKFIKQGGTAGEHLVIPSTAVGIKDLAEDVVVPGLDIQEVLMNAPRKRGRFFVVPKVVE